jgi:hypothetical protein
MEADPRLLTPLAGDAGRPDGMREHQPQRDLPGERVRIAQAELTSGE